MKIFYLLASLIILVSSCHTSSTNKVLEMLDETEITPNVFADEIIMVPPSDMIDVGTHLLFIVAGMKHYALFVDKQDPTSVQEVGKVGSEPDDLVDPSYIGFKNNKLQLYDFNLRRYTEFELLKKDSVQLKRIDSKTTNTGEIVLLKYHIMDNGQIVGFVGIGARQMFALLDKSFTILKTFGEPPIEGFIGETFFQFVGRFASFGNKMFFACANTGYIVCYNIDNHQNVSKEWEHFVAVPHYDLQQMRWGADNKDGFFDIQANSQYIFAAYSGKTHRKGTPSIIPQNILVFEHNGQLVKNIKYKNASFIRIALSQNNRIYTVGEDEVTVCDWTNWNL